MSPSRPELHRWRLPHGWIYRWLVEGVAVHRFFWSESAARTWGRSHLGAP